MGLEGRSRNCYFRLSERDTCFVRPAQLRLDQTNRDHFWKKTTNFNGFIIAGKGPFYMVLECGSSAAHDIHGSTAAPLVSPTSQRHFLGLHYTLRAVAPEEENKPKRKTCTWAARECDFHRRHAAKSTWRIVYDYCG